MNTLHLIAIILSAIFILDGRPVYAQGQPTTSTASKNVFVGGVSGFFFSDKAQRGDQELPGGRTTFVYSHVQYNMAKYYSGFGLFYERDSLGLSQRDEHYGLKYELFLDEYYLEIAYGWATQTFTGRSIEKRDGTAVFLGFGRRIPILNGLLHFDLSIKQRSSTYDTEDGKDLPDVVTRTTLVPFLGVGKSL